MATAKTVYVAQDGAEFESATDCDAHDAAIAAGPKISEFIEKMGFGKGPAGLMRNNLPLFVAFLNGGSLPNSEEAGAAGDGTGEQG